jgi:glycosyltransferase involved in cell wall biosynthesis
VKILHVVRYTKFGGIENYTQDLFPELERRGHANVLIVAGELLDGVRAAGRVVNYLPEIARFDHGSTQRSLAAVREIMQATQPDVAYLHTAMPWLVADPILRRLPAVYFAHEYGAFSPSGALLFERSGTVCNIASPPGWRCLVNAYLKKCNSRRPDRLVASVNRARQTKHWALRADAIICDSTFVANRYALAGFDRRRLRILPSPVPVPPESLLEASAPRPAQRMILFCGRLVSGKGLAVLIQALPDVRGDWVLKIAGDGPERGRLGDLVRTLRLAQRVRYLGRVNREEMVDLYREATVVVVPSIWPEPLGMVGLEALSHGRPVVGSAVGGITEWLIENETGLTVRPGDPRELADRINRLLDDPELARRLGQAGRRLVESRFALARHVDELLDTFASACADHAAKGRIEESSVRRSHA